VALREKGRRRWLKRGGRGKLGIGKQLGDALEIRNRITLYWGDVPAIRSPIIKGKASSYLDKQVYLQAYYNAQQYFT
jgi:hypothetical protein